MEQQSNNPIHGKKIEQILKELVAYYGWDHLGHKIQIGCFKSNPTIGSSLTFLRRTNWAKSKVEALYIEMHTKNQAATLKK
jgi:uncharacterized protein (DUF2132 family)